MWNLLYIISRAIDGVRPCKKTVKVIEQNVAATTELTKSITTLTDTLTSAKPLSKRATDSMDDESWRQRRSTLR